MRKICVSCQQLVSDPHAHSVLLTHEDPAYPNYWDCAPDMRNLKSRRSWATLLLSSAALVLVISMLSDLIR